MFVCKNCKSIDKFELMFAPDYKGSNSFSWEYNANKDIVITVKWNEDSVVSSKSVRFTAELDYVQSTTNFEQTVTNTNNNV